MKKHLKFLGLFLLIAVVCVPFLVSCHGQIEGANADSVVNSVFPNLWVALAQILATIVLLSTIIGFVWEPYKKMMKERKEYYMKDINDAKDAKESALLDQQKSREEFIKAQSEASKIIMEANDSGSKLIQSLETDAKRKAKQIVENAKFEMDIAKKEHEKSIKNEIVDIAFATAEELSRKEISKEDNDKFVDEFIEKMRKEDK